MNCCAFGCPEVTRREPAAPAHATQVQDRAGSHGILPEDRLPGCRPRHDKGGEVQGNLDFTATL